MTDYSERIKFLEKYDIKTWGMEDGSVKSEFLKTNPDPHVFQVIQRWLDQKIIFINKYESIGKTDDPKITRDLSTRLSWKKDRASLKDHLMKLKLNKVIVFNDIDSVLTGREVPCFICLKPYDKAVILFSFWEDEGYIQKSYQKDKPVFSSDRVREAFKYYSSRNKKISGFTVKTIRKTRSELAVNGEVEYSDIANIFK